MKTVAGLTLVAVAAVLTAGPSAIAAQDEDFEWSGTIARGDVIEIKGVSGNIWATLASGNRVEVVARMHGRRRDFDDVHIEVVEDDDGVTICAMYPVRRGRRRHNSRRGPNECEPGGWHDLNIRNTDVEVDFEVRVPAGVRFVGRTISGNVEAEGLDSHVLARTVSGDIYVSTSDLADVSTVSGSIEAEMGRADWRGDLEFATVSGDITLSFPDNLATEVEFESLSGDMDSDFPISIRSRSNRWIGGHIRGTIGDGGRSLSLKTLSGDLWLRRAR